jgi:hypothetical protein
VRDVKPNYYSKAEKLAPARAAERAKGLIEKATHKRNQLVNHYAARAAHGALDEVKKGIAYLNKIGSNESIDIGYRDQIDQLLERFDLRNSTSLKAIDKRKSLADWIKQQEGARLRPTISDELRNEAFRKSFKDMTVEEVRGLVDAVKNIEHLGKLKKKLLTRRISATSVTWSTDLIVDQGAREENTARAPRSDRGFPCRSAPEALFRTSARSIASSRALRASFDGWQDGGTCAWDYLVRNMNERGNFEAVEREKATLRLGELFQADPRRAGKLGEKQLLPGSGKSFTREERIGIALNMGNEVNRERVMTGEKLTPRSSTEILEHADERRTGSSCRGVWDYLESFRPQIAEKERRLTGFEPEWVEPTPVQTKHGEFKGGYYPIVRPAAQ